MKKIMMIAMLMVLLVGCTPKSDDTLVVGFTDYPPMGFKDVSGEIVGFDIDFAKEVAKVMNRDVTFQYINWDAKVLELNSNQIDLIWNGFTVTEERKKEVLFSNPYIVNALVAIVRVDDTTITNLEDLDGKNIAVESESSGQKAVEETFSSSVTLNRFTAIGEALLDLKAGNSDVVIADEIYARYLTSKDTSVRVVPGIAMNAQDYAVGLRLEDKGLQEELNAAIQTVVDNGTASEISLKWFGEDIIKR